MQKINLEAAAHAVDGLWNPLLLAELNGQSVKLAKFKGTFDWHHHDAEDEAFLVVKGQIRIGFRDHSVTLDAGEMLVVPRGVKHRPEADAEALVLMFEPSTTLNTGNVTTDKTRHSLKKLSTDNP